MINLGDDKAAARHCTKFRNHSKSVRQRLRKQLPFWKTMISMILITPVVHHSRGLVRSFSLRHQGRRLQFPSSSDLQASETLSSSEYSSPKTPTGLILPSHPDTPITNVMAPMVSASDYPFRHFLRQHYGVQLTYTQMLHSKNFCKDPKFRRAHLDLWEAGATYEKLLPSQVACLGYDNGDEQQDPVLTGTPHKGAPLMVQLAGHDVDLIVETALRIMDHTNGGAAGFDLNCGCPQQIARKGQYGAFLMEENDALVCEILSALCSALPPMTAVSAKIRLPMDDTTLRDRIPRLVQTGINFMTIHGRTLLENKTKVGAVHTDRIRMAIEAAHSVDPDFPVVANGGMETYRDVQKILHTTGAVAAMSSEALLETPDLFQAKSLDRTHRQRMEAQFRFARQYLDVCATVSPPVPGVLGTSKYKGGSFVVVRGHLFKFLHRYLQEQPDLRDRLAEDKKLTTIPQARALVEELYERYAELSDEQWEGLESSSSDASWYRRHRKEGRHVHQKEVRVDSSTVSSSQVLSVEERKRQIQQRIQRLQNQNQRKAESNVQRSIS